MTIHIHSQHFKVTERLEEFATRKLERLYRYLPHIREIDLDLGRQRTKRGGEVITSAQITVRHERGMILRAEEKLKGEQHEAIEAAINAAIDKLYRQIERFKGKQNNHKGKTRFSLTLEELQAAEATPAAAANGAVAIEVEDVEIAQVVRRKTIPVLPMDEIEAVEQMELLGHSFFVFFNSDTNSVNVVYKRSDGDYGVLIPTMA
jgi:putative sigma-54 modulation protein